MKKNILFISLLLFATIALGQQQNGVTQWGAPTGQPQFPQGEYIELPNPSKTDFEKWRDVKNVNVAWGNTDTRYAKAEPPIVSQKNKTLKTVAWRGERVNVQMLVFGNTDVKNLTYRIEDLKNSKTTIASADIVKSGFVRYVMTDELNKDKQGACGHRPDITLYDSSLVADVIDNLSDKIELKSYTTQPVWLQFWIPQNVAAGKYTTQISVFADAKKITTLQLEIEVLNKVLPLPRDWKFHLDLWQNPFAEARYFGVEPWSAEHFAAMKPTFERLANAGQKVITTSIMHKPWGGQTEDYFESMVTWMKRVDGSWSFDFAVFDKWVEFMMSLGIDKQINCYSMIPWNMSFKYFDQATNNFKTLQVSTSDAAYAEVWTALLRDFSKHLKQKHWFDITTIAMDERSPQQMQDALKIIKNADADFKVSLAGNWHPELESHLYDYCIAYRSIFPENVLAERKNAKKISTYYTCCTEPYPNTFTFSPPAEAEWLGWYAAKIGVDGYLRWAYNSYTKEPLLDSRFRSFAAGDCYMVYPQGRSSIRFERLVNGIQAYEKIQILKSEFLKTNNVRGLQAIDNILKIFTNENLTNGLTAEIVANANKQLNDLSK